MKLSGKTKIKKQCLGLSLSHIQLSFPFFLPLCLFLLNEHWNKTVENGAVGGLKGPQLPQKTKEEQKSQRPVATATTSSQVPRKPLPFQFSCGPELIEMRHNPWGEEHLITILLTQRAQW